MPFRLTHEAKRLPVIGRAPRSGRVGICLMTLIVVTAYMYEAPANNRAAGAVKNTPTESLQSLLARV